MIPDDPLVHRARELARVAHADQVRKAGEVPYFTHLEGVAEILVEHGHDEPETVAAAYLHDLVEDQPAHVDRMRAEMPREVVEAVLALTEVKRDDRGEKLSKRVRFEGYVRRLSTPSEAVRRALPISCADKIHNTRSIVEAERDGTGLLMALSTRPGEHDGQLRALRALYASAVAPSLLAAFDEARDALARTIEAWLPGRAVMIAAGAHLGQLDLGGQPYIEHPLRLMMRADDPESKIVAVLHDVVEDSGWTFERLRREGFSERVLRALGALTKRDGEAYDAFVERVARNHLATRVKLLDLSDNRDLSRIPEPTERDRARVQKYERAIARLNEVLPLRSLQVQLDPPSREAVRARAVHAVVRGDHVTLAHRVDPSAFDPAWVPGGHRVDAPVELEVRAEHVSDDVQALSLSMAGTRRRPHDGGPLHVTVSRVEGTRSKASNALVAKTKGTPVSLTLSGRVCWMEP